MDVSGRGETLLKVTPAKVWRELSLEQYACVGDHTCLACGHLHELPVSVFEVCCENKTQRCSRDHLDTQVSKATLTLWIHAKWSHGQMWEEIHEVAICWSSLLMGIGRVSTWARLITKRPNLDTSSIQYRPH